MNPPHLRPEDAEQYVLGALEPDAAAALEAHTLGCPPCATLLQREALLEEQLREVARAVPPEARVIRPARWNRVWGAAMGAALAVAAAVALVLLRPERGTPPESPEDDFPVMALPENLPARPERLVACPDLPSQETCASEALARGLLVQYPQGVGQVPRYEGYAGLPPDALKTDRPSPL